MVAVPMAIPAPQALVTKAALLMMTVFAPGNNFFVLFLFMFCNITKRFFFLWIKFSDQDKSLFIGLAVVWMV